jgi:hypothetical protein
MPRGKGIYVDEPREHRKTYSHEPADEHEHARNEATPDDTSSKDASEPSG